MRHHFRPQLALQLAICLAICVLVGCGSESPPATSDSVPAVPAAEPSGDTTVASSEQSTGAKMDQEAPSMEDSATAKGLAKSAPAEAATQEVAVDQTPREPATVAEAAKLLDLRTLPLLEGADVPGGRTQLGSLYYSAKAELPDAFAFHRQQLKELDWQELPGSRLGGANPRAVFTQAGFVVALSASEVSYPPEKEGFVSVSINNHGNVLSRNLPLPEGAKESYVDNVMAIYTTTADADQTRSQCDQLLLDLGWKPYGSAGDTRYFKQNAIKLSAGVSTHENQPGKTFISYHTELLSADLPMPTDYEDPRYDDSQKQVSFDCPEEDIAKVTEFYTQALTKQGWKPTADPTRIDDQTFVIYRNQASDMIELEFYHFRDICRVSVAHSTALEVAELERQMKEEAQRRAAELAAAKTKTMSKIAIPIPGKAKKVTQDDDESMDIVVAKGSAKAVLKAWEKHFKAAGWQSDTAEFGDDFGFIHLSKGDPAIDLEYLDTGIGDDVTLEVRGINATFEPLKSLPAFAALGAPVTVDPPPADVVAKAPADIPIPADAQKLKVQPNANVMYDVAGDIADVARYFREAMEEHGWEFDEDFSQVDDTHALLSFKKGRAPCSASITDILETGVASVTIAGGGMKWDELKGDEAELDLAVAKFLAEAAPDSPPARGLLAKQVPIPEEAADLQIEGDLEMIIYRSELSVTKVADFYRKALGKLGWEEVEDETFLDDDLGAGGIGFAKGDDTLRVAIQDGQSESKTRILIQGEGIVWPNGEGDDLGDVAMEKETDEPADDEIALRVSEVKVGKCEGFVQRNEEKFELKHALAFQATEFDEPVTVVYVSEKPFRTKGLEGTKVEDMMIFDWRSSDNPPSMEVRIRGEYVSISCFVGNHSINITSPDFKSEAFLKDGRLRGKVFSPKPHEFFDDTFQFSVLLDVELMTLAEAAPPTRLAASEEYRYPLPVGSEEVSSESGPYRTVIRGWHSADLGTMTDFYRVELTDVGWEEEATATKTAETTANMSFHQDEAVLRVELRRTDDQTHFTLAGRDEAAAKKDGVVPEDGKAKILLANSTDAEIVIMIDDTEHKIAAGLGGRDPADAKKIDLAPGKHKVVIKVPGEKPQSEEVEIKAGTAWAFVAFGNEGYLADRIY